MLALRKSSALKRLVPRNMSARAASNIPRCENCTETAKATPRPCLHEPVLACEREKLQMQLDFAEKLQAQKQEADAMVRSTMVGACIGAIIGLWVISPTEKGRADRA